MSSRGTIRWSEYGTFAVVPEWILDSAVSDRAVRLFGVLSRYANGPELSVMPTRKTLSERLRCSTSTLDVALTELRDLGALTWTERRRDDGGRGANEYVLHPTPLPEDRVPPTDGSVGPPTDGSVGNEREHVRTRGVRTASSPALVKIGGRNLGFDALVRVCHVDVRNTRRIGELTKALKDIRLYVAEELPGVEGERFERELAARVEARAAKYRDRMRDVRLTPSALAKWWHDVETDATRSGTSADDFRGMADFDE